MFYLIIFVFLLLFLGICILWLIYKNRELEAQCKEKAKQLNIMFAKRLDSELSNWLLMLELPQLEEEKKRLEVGRQLRIVLIERLLLSQNPDYSHNRP